MTFKEMVQKWIRDASLMLLLRSDLVVVRAVVFGLFQRPVVETVRRVSMFNVHYIKREHKFAINRRGETESINASVYPAMLNSIR